MLVKGYLRSVILDIQRGILDFIPNELYEIYHKYNKQEINHILLRISAYPHPVLPKKTSAKCAQRIKKRCHFGMNRPD